MRILIAGASGLVGTALCKQLVEQDHEICILERSGKSGDTVNKNPKVHSIFWDPSKGMLDLEKLENFDAFVNLAGENISQRWNQKAKERILRSRVHATELLCNRAVNLKNPPKVIINASAIGFYGNRGDELLNENSPSGSGFVAEVCRQWEAATAPAAQKGIRVVLTRFGVILSPEGGALKKMLMPFKLCLGGKIGAGNQYMSWVAIDDVVKILILALNQPAIKGPVNVVAPRPVTNAAFTQALADELHRPALLPVPAFAINLIFGEMGQELLLSSTRVEPQKLTQLGYQFIYPEIEKALDGLLKSQ